MVISSARTRERRSSDWPAPEHPVGPADSVYFAGYAMWNYLTTPYLLTREGAGRGSVETPGGVSIADHPALARPYVDAGGSCAAATTS